MRGRLHSIAASFVLLVALATPGWILAAGPTAASAASPSPAASEVTVAGQPIEVWLDAPVNVTEPPGGFVLIGVTLWDAEGSAMVPTNSMSVWWPSTAKGAPWTTAPLNPDWPGHGSAAIRVPRSPSPNLRVTFPGGCDATGCPPGLGFPVTGVGPPPKALLPMIASATLDPVTGAVAGVPADVTVVLKPKTDWGAAFQPPASLVLQGRVPRQPDLFDVPAHLVDPDAGRYAGTVTFPDPGSYLLEVASDVHAGLEGSFITSTTTVIVGPADASTPPPPGTAAPAGGQSGSDPLLPAALLAVAALMFGGLVLVVRRTD